MMHDDYTSAFYDIVRETQDKHGYELPIDIEAYVVMLLASHIDKPDFLPPDTFIESYMRLSNPYGYRAKVLGDTCLFTVGVFPEYGSRHGIPSEYFSNIGKNSYHLAKDQLDQDLFDTLSVHFDYLKNFINVCVHKQQVFDVSRFFKNR